PEWVRFKGGRSRVHGCRRHRSAGASVGSSSPSTDSERPPTTEKQRPSTRTRLTPPATIHPPKAHKGGDPRRSVTTRPAYHGAVRRPGRCPTGAMIST